MFHTRSIAHVAATRTSEGRVLPPPLPVRDVSLTTSLVGSTPKGGPLRKCARRE